MNKVVPIEANMPHTVSEVMYVKCLTMGMCATIISVVKGH